MSASESTITEGQLWRAFQYVAGELSAEQAESFEQQMLSEPVLCEAVLEATTLTTAVALSGRRLDVVHAKSSTVEFQVVADSPGNRLRRSVAALVTVVSCLCFAVIFFRPLPEPEMSTEWADLSRPDSAELLVTAWAGNSESLSWEEPEPEELAVSDLAVPDWMLAAVSLSDQDGLLHSSEGSLPPDDEIF